jgi:DNA-binding transcriptional LysR family regulator
VESGSFSAVARELGVGQPAVSKQVASLEAHLGAQLLMRTSRNLSLTEAGRDFYKSGARLIGDLEAAESRVVGSTIIGTKTHAKPESHPSQRTAPGSIRWNVGLAF